MNIGVRRRFGLTACALLASVGLSTPVASPAAAEEDDEPPPCEVGYDYYPDEPCSGGDGWVYYPPVFVPQGTPVGCGVTVIERDGYLARDYLYYYRNCHPPGGAMECVTWIDPQLMKMSWSNGRKYAARYPEQAGYFGNDTEFYNYEHPTDPYYGDTIIPASLFVKELEPGEICNSAQGLPPLWAGPGPGGTDPIPPSDDDPCAGSHARCNSNGPDGEDPGVAPHVTVFGQVTAPINLVPPEGDADRPLAGAKYELWYYGKDGPDTTVTWRPVRSGVDSSHRPSGYPVRGNLDANGAYRLDFVYPQDYTLADGATWEGCPQTGHSFLRSHACEPDHLQLRIYAENANRSVIIEDVAVEDDPLRMHTVPLGWFALRADGEQISTATSEWALAYRGVYNVRDIWTPAAAPVVRVRIDDNDNTRYDQGSQVIHLDRSDAGYHGIEHETAHRYQHHVYGHIIIVEPECHLHSYDLPSAPKCAFIEGLAQFVSAAAHGNPRLQRSPIAHHDIETCESTDLEGSYPCDTGPMVEGNVAGFLWDLFDAGLEQETLGDWVTGLADDQSTSFMTIMEVIASAKPETFIEFWSAWAASSPDRASDRELAWLNQMSLVVLQDASLDGATGQWTSADCEQCTSAEFLRSSGDQDGSHVWSLTEDIPPFTYDIWIRLPQGQPGHDPDARYRVTAQGGVEEVSVDQRNAAGGWVNLKQAGFTLDPGGEMTVTLVTGTPGTSLVADAILLTPHID